MCILSQWQSGRHQNTAVNQHGFCQNLVHGDGRRGQTTMCIGNIHNIQQALDIAIFANLAVQGVEHTTRLKFGKFGGNIAVNLDLNSIPARIARRLPTKAGADPADRCLGSPSPHKNCDTFVMRAHSAPS